jgi:carboxymethylenebutenolidase
LFDRVRPGIELGYGEADIAEGRDIRTKISDEDALKDIAAARDALRDVGRRAAIGFCWGGRLAWLAATRLSGFDAVVGFYGGIGNVAEEQPLCPVLFHFGNQDHAIPLSDVDKLRTAHPAEVEVHLYDAGNGFNCDQRGSFHGPSVELARHRSLAFLGQHIG